MSSWVELDVEIICNTTVDMSYAMIRGFGLQWCFTNGEIDFLGLAKIGMNTLLLPAKGFDL